MKKKKVFRAYLECKNCRNLFNKDFEKGYTLKHGVYSSKTWFYKGTGLTSFLSKTFILCPNCGSKDIYIKKRCVLK
ncbi:MAG: hypothetical protein ACTSXD_08410 [Candidatus Heimdallarchaeaceae archaeon]